MYECLNSDTEPEDNEQVPLSQYAYVFLVMKGNSYIPGVVAAVESLRQTDTKHNIVCLYTKDVTDNHILKEICDYTHEVPYLKYKTKPLLTEKQQKIYASWSNCSYTKWQCLALDEYEKILFVDADMIILENIDHLFELKAPAATFSSPWSSIFTNEGEFSSAFKVDKTGDKVDYNDIQNAFENSGYLFIASLVLLEPNINALDEIMYLLEKHEPYGFNNFNSPDEQILIHLYQGTDWTHINQEYNFIIHKKNWLGDGQVPKVLHYFNHMKPWVGDKLWFETPFSTDNIWWYYFYIGSKNIDVKLNYKFASILNKKKNHKFKFKISYIDDEYFPWIRHIRKKQFYGKSA